MSSIFVKENIRKQKVNLYKSSGVMSLGIVILMVCFWFVIDSWRESARAQVKINQDNVFVNVNNESLDDNILVFPNVPIENNVPNKVEIKDLGINLDIVPQIAKDGQIEVSDMKGNYLVGSGVIGEKQNIVIFAHKRRGMFANLSQANIGQVVMLKSKDRVGEYEIVSAYETRDNDMTVVSPDGFYGITLYTCNRWDDSYRFVVRAREIRTYELY